MLWKQFVNENLQIKKDIQVNNLQVKPNNNPSQNTYTLTGTLQNFDTWGLIFSQVKNLKGSNLSINKCYSPEVEEVLKDFRYKLSQAKLNKEKANISNLNYISKDSNLNAYDIIKSKFCKSLNQ
jgi:hypothetical protein